jgi:hypothetical protein
MLFYNKKSILLFAVLAVFSCKNTKEISVSQDLYSDNDETAISDDQNELTDDQSQKTLDSTYYMDKSHLKSIHTVLLHPLENELLEPIIHLSSQEKLLLSFDDLDQTPKNLFYTLIHCDNQWQPSDLFKSEYLQGFDQDYIESPQSSYNTIQFYSHYRTTIPSQNMVPLYSGNYIIHVFDEDYPQEVILSKRMRIIDNKIKVNGSVKRATDLDQRNYQHEIDFSLNHSGLTINDPFNDIKVIISQNNRWDNAISGLQPNFVNNGQLIYDQEDFNLFDGGNEYRFFEIKSLRYLSERLANISFENDTNVVVLRTDTKRSFQTYSSVRDINGKKLIKVQEGTNSEIEADYALVNFSLPYDREITHGDLYVFGHISDYDFLPSHKMIFNQETKRYQSSIYLKQGYYNYEYILKKDDGESINRFIEGTHYETINDYFIYIYYRPLGTDYDQLLGYQKLSSKGLF